MLRQARVVAVYINVNVNGRVRRRARGAERNPRVARSGKRKREGRRLHNHSSTRRDISTALDD